MYRPPQNSNRVKSIKNKFESIDSTDKAPSSDSKPDPSNNVSKNGLSRRSYLVSNGNYSNIKNNLEQLQTKQISTNYARISPSNNGKQLVTKKPVLTILKDFKSKSDLKTNNSNKNPSNNNTNNRPPLNRQLSDPIKRNIKRTPAFRLDSNKSPDLVTKSTNHNSSNNKNSNSSFSRKNALYQSTFESKVKQFSALKNCDNNNSSHGNDKNNVTTICVTGEPVLLKSKSSIDFAYLRSKFDSNQKDCTSSTIIISNSNENNNKVIIRNERDTIDGAQLNECQNNDRVSVIRIVSDNNDSNEHIYQNGNFSTQPDKSTLINNINKIYQKVEDLYQKESPSEKNDKPTVDLSKLYTEPIPKCQRIKIQDFHNAATLKLNDKIPSDPDLTDTLKSALRRPLPPGPAPKKPPRTFQHPPLPNPNKSFLYLEKNHSPTNNIESNSVTKTKPKNDPKYMLSKLENALKNNKLRSRTSKQKKAAEVKRLDLSTTSGEEDSDDSLLFRSKTLPKLPSANYLSNSPNSKLGSFNCLQMNCGVGGGNAYERIVESKSSFFVKEEPVYDEPINLRTGNEKSKLERNLKKNSLYYMSSPIMGNNSGGGEKMEDALETKFDNAKKPHDLNLLNNAFRSQVMISAENSSLSSFTSDLESTPSPMEETCGSKTKCLIDTFESYQNRVEEAPINGNNDRVENLKNHLQRTLNNTFGCQNDFDEENVCVADMITKFETYRKNVPKYCQPQLVHKDRLFYCCLVIEKVKNITQIKFKFPACAQIPPNIELLCFPEGENMHLDSTSNSYSLSLTNELGERTYGYCKRVLPEGSPTCLPLTYCILSKYKAPRFYKKILDELESRHGIRNKCRDELIAAFYNQKFPKPGESIKIHFKSISGTKIDDCNGKIKSKDDLDLKSHIQVTCGQYGTINRQKNKKPEDNCEDIDKELVLTLHQDVLYENADLIRLHKLPVDVLQKIFSSLLLERKIVLISQDISDLSTCVESLQSLLYPFTWCHTFIPILPDDLWDIVESPTPLICGVLCDKVVVYHKVENGMVVNIDTGEVLVEEGDELKIMSGSMVKTWRKSLTYASREINGNNYVYNVLLRQAYLQVFRLCFQNVYHFIADGVFQKADFLKNAKSKGLRNFLRMFVETNMFMAFQDTILNLDNVAVDELFKANKVDNYNKTSDKLFHWK